MSGIDFPIHDPDVDRWVNGEISNEEWKALVLAKHRARQQEFEAVTAQSAPPKRRRWLSRLLG